MAKFLSVIPASDSSVHKLSLPNVCAFLPFRDFGLPILNCSTGKRKKETNKNLVIQVGNA